ncbi:hypothetical protein GCM10010460_19090 [Microbacterium terrae]|uniref:Uncharacterized protein n=1 Tax=Microbacterium terrae TaxID=69369 RepID=A0A0M2HMT1_9MICO|nr:hypothetical protein RS81_00092 [Microbacterium terrae]GLJ97553.1 hypothetical protein GCM10017594_07500 [Microbacterium terrae]
MVERYDSDYITLSGVLQDCLESRAVGAGSWHHVLEDRGYSRDFERVALLVGGLLTRAYLHVADVLSSHVQF